MIYQSPIQQWSFNCPYQLGSSKKGHPDLAMVCKLITYVLFLSCFSFRYSTTKINIPCFLFEGFNSLGFLGTVRGTPRAASIVTLIHTFIVVKHSSPSWSTISNLLKSEPRKLISVSCPACWIVFCPWFVLCVVFVGLACWNPQQFSPQLMPV